MEGPNILFDVDTAKDAECVDLFINSQIGQMENQDSSISKPRKEPVAQSASKLDEQSQAAGKATVGREEVCEVQRIRAESVNSIPQANRSEKAYSVCGTPEYMSPELITQTGHNTLTDWWAFGIVLYELATGEPPFQNTDFELMAEEIRFQECIIPKHFSKSFSDLIKRLLHKIPRLRLGRNGSHQIKEHPFFCNVNWDAVRAKKTKPPIVPHPEMRNSSNRSCSYDSSDQTSEKLSDNPYILLKENFSSKVYDRDIALYQQKCNKNTPIGDHDSDSNTKTESMYLSNFTYDKNIFGSICSKNGY